MNDDAYAKLVASEVQNRAPDHLREYLNEDLERWNEALQALDGVLDRQLQALTNEVKTQGAILAKLGGSGMPLFEELQATIGRQRLKIARFKFHVNARQDYVQRMIALNSDLTEEKAKIASYLRKAIERHRELTHNPTSVDEYLWATLDGKWLFNENP